MSLNRKQCRYTSLFIMFCIVMSCFNIHTTSVSVFSTQSSLSDSPHTIYKTYINKSNSDACTPELLCRQKINSQSFVLHKNNKFSHTYRLLSYVTNIIDSIHIPLYHNLIEHILIPCELISTVIIIRYIHSQDGKKKFIHNFLSL